MIQGRINSQGKTKVASEEFEAILLREVGGNPSAVKLSLVLAACATHAALYSLHGRLKTARNFKRIQVLSAELPALTANLLKVLAALGIDGGADDSTGIQTIAAYVAARTPVKR